MDGAVLCVFRARFFRLEVRLFGTAMGLSRALRFGRERYVWCGVGQLRFDYFDDSRSCLRAFQRGSTSS
jgi:hypothetical protein